MDTIDQLREMMTLSADMNNSDIEIRFNQIAQILFERLAIIKGKTKYLFKEIEFYYYNKNHRDIITHPRISKPLFWYVNDFGGIDLNFKSNIDIKQILDKKGKNVKKYSLNDNAHFGGILIRQLMSEDGNEILNGPWACAELFREYDATAVDKELPLLIECNNGMVGYIREPRKNLLSSKQTVKSKVEFILQEYNEYQDVKMIYEDFKSFINKRYRYIRCSTLIHDKDTNEVYFSPWLKDQKEGHPEFYQRLSLLLNEIGIEVKELKHTKDYWARDYMPLQLREKEFLKYRYYPNYLVKSKNKKDLETITDVTKVLRDMHINHHSTKLIIDGGNMVACGPYIVMTDKVFSENGYEKGDVAFKELLESELGHPVIIIPWTLHGDFHADDTDKYGHSDGFIKWCGENRILMSNHRDYYPQEASAIRQILESYGFKISEMQFNDKVSSPCSNLNWAYINFLQVGDKIIMPKFDIEEDNIAEQYIRESFPNCTIHSIEMKEIVLEGGALHCISWNIKM